MIEDLNIYFSRLALNLASNGVGLVSPNPLVGCVVVSTTGEIVGEGTYIYDSVTHAEVLALEYAGNLAKGGTAYVSLEPHDHHGKTPPCTEALINAGIRRVVCPIEDPNPLVAGKGFERLKRAGIEVVIGLLADEAAKLNEKFICWHTKRRPFVHLKLATSLDGRISLRDSVSTALSANEAHDRVQNLRHEYDAILVGGNTAFVDDPSLTDRSGKMRRRKLTRVILDNRLQIPLDSRLVATAEDIPTLVCTNSKDHQKIDALRSCHVDILELSGNGRNLSEVLDGLKKRDLQCVLVEGGTEIAGAFCDAGLIDKLTFIAAPLIIGGRVAPMSIGGRGAQSLTDAMRLGDITIRHLGEDIEITAYPKTAPEKDRTYGNC